MQQPKVKILISGGGTGGHIFPAIAIAESIKKSAPETEILFVGAKGRMEMEKVPAAGYPIEALWISGLQRRLTLKNLSFPLKLISSFIKARKIINSFHPDVVVGTGGYASGPTLKAAASMGIPTVIQEQNSFPGITNKLLSKKANKICVAYEGMQKYFPDEKIILTGNPIRNDLINIKNKKKEAAEIFSLEQSAPTVLVVGGSQGAKAINEAIHANLDVFSENNIQLVWQTGKYYHNTAIESFDARKYPGIKILEFIKRIDLAYSMADIIISRAGAIAISEICVTGKPTIFVPLPTAAEDHQTKNAQALVSKNAALMVKNNQAGQKLIKEVIELFNDKSKQKKLSSNISKLAITDAGDQIAKEVLKLVIQKSNGS